jgi:hypothetical protein
MAMHFMGRALVLGALMGFSVAALAGRDDDADPDNGQSWLSKFEEHESRDGQLWSGTIRATDDFGATHDRDFRLAASGSIARGDRVVVLNRYEPECFELAAVARLSLDDYCDQLTLTWRDGDAVIAFSSLDANRRYSFTLRADPRAPNDWTSLKTAVPAPALSLSNGLSGGDVSYRWDLITDDGHHRQSGEVTASQLRDADLHPLEVGLLGLGEVLLTFNRYAFTRSMLPRDDPAYAPTPYAAWAEETVEGGCIFTICFGNLGGGAGGAGNNYNACSPGHPNYNPANCPHDLTYARWPVGMRPKLQKVNNGKVIGHIFVKNTGTGDVYVPAIPGNLQIPFAFFSLIRLGSETPLVSSTSTIGSPYGGQCYELRMGLYFEVVNPFVTVDLKAGQAKPMDPIVIECSQSSSRPAGRYRLHIHIDPMSAYDTPGYDGNNIGHSGTLDWVNLRN